MLESLVFVCFVQTLDKDVLPVDKYQKVGRHSRDSQWPTRQVQKVGKEDRHIIGNILGSLYSVEHSRCRANLHTTQIVNKRGHH